MSESNIYVSVAGFIGRSEATGAVGIFRRPVEGDQWEHVYKERETFTVYVHPNNSEYIYTDGNHLYKESGKIVTEKIAHWIKNIEEK